jgi:hypothetical protein
MANAFVVSKNSVDFYVSVDGKIEVKPIPHKGFNEETLYTLAQKHMVIIEWRWIRNNKKGLHELAIDYFENGGFEIKQNR